MKSHELIAALGGITATARILGIKPPSVAGWVKDGIPEGRLIQLAATLEVKTGGEFSRKKQWPDTFQTIWPELAVPSTESQKV